VEPHRDVVEVGCGTGNYILALVEAMDCHGWGVDPDDEMLRIAR
jgi:ubiquinone/menaquinone biosynthesis C-methylase UbiE